MPPRFRLSRIHNTYRLDSADGPYFAFLFDTSPDGKLEHLAISRPYLDGSATVGFRTREPFDWQPGRGTLTSETCSGTYRVTLTRPQPGTWDFDVSPLPGAKVPEGAYTRARISFRSGPPALPDRWRAAKIVVDATTSDARYVFNADLSTSAALAD